MDEEKEVLEAAIDTATEIINNKQKEIVNLSEAIRKAIQWLEENAVIEISGDVDGKKEQKFIYTNINEVIDILNRKDK